MSIEPPMHARGKFDNPSGRYHLLEHHCADVAACFEALLLDPVLRERFRKAAGESGFCRITRARLAVLTFLHDFGKLSVGFQFRKMRNRNGLPSSPPTGHIREAFWCCEREAFCKALGLLDMAEAWGPEAFELLLRAAFAHHGRPAEQSGTSPRWLWQPHKDYHPLEAAKLLGQRCRAWFPEAFESGPPLPDSSRLAHLFAGTVTLADHIGSDEELFPYESSPDPEYIRRARKLADEGVAAKGFGRGGRSVRATSVDVQTLFGHEKPRPVQAEVQGTPLDRPLMILESETGSGKTEAAVLRFAALWEAGLVDGLYFAVPTRAAAKQLHRRIDYALKQLFGDQAWSETVLAVPGYVIAGAAEGGRVGFEVSWKDEPDEGVRQARWAAESARKFLCATAAVGTVDQVLLAGLQVKWAHLRGAALARSLLVVDEVHASDTYMTRLLRTVLRDHLAVGGHALLMSATLGSAAREGFVGNERIDALPGPDEAKAVAYPTITFAATGPSQTLQIEDAGVSKHVFVQTEPILADPGRIAAMALTAAQEGAKVLVIRNTVLSAVSVFDALRHRGGSELALSLRGGPALHHSRFAAEDRALLDEAAAKALGNQRERGGLVVVGTQTLEQSLDIDADFLISDLCPADVLLQRIGRLHRHRETDRPAAWQEARCVVIAPEGGVKDGLEGGLARYGLGPTKSGGVYANCLVLEATHRLIVRHPVWEIPAMNRELVEGATHPHSLRRLAKELGRAWMEAEQEAYGRDAAQGGIARLHMLDRQRPFDEDMIFPEDINEKIRTRLGEDACRIELRESAPGPFGERVRTFSLPAHFFRGGGGLPSKEEVTEASAEEVSGGLVLEVGERSFGYDRRGLKPDRS